MQIKYLTPEQVARNKAREQYVEACDDIKRAIHRYWEPGKHIFVPYIYERYPVEVMTKAENAFKEYGWHFSHQHISKG